MGSISYVRMPRPQLLAAIGVVAWTCSCAADGLEPMAATGGMMNDPVRRLSTAMPRKDVPKQADVMPERQVGQKTGSGGEKTIGEIESVKIFGSKEFAEKVGLAGRLLAALKDNGAKTNADVENAIFKVMRELRKEGYYLVSILPLRGKAYDPEAKTLSVMVNQGSFGKTSVKFGKGDEGVWFSSRQIYRRFKDIEEGQAFDYTRLRGLIFDVNSHPDLTIDTFISVRSRLEGEGDAAQRALYADLNLDVHESCPIHAVWEVNNYGMKEIDKWQTSLTAQYLNLTKHDDVLTVSPGMSFGGEMFSLAGSYMLPHEWWLGGNTTLYGGWSYLDVDNIVSRLDLEGVGYFAGLQHSENLYNSDRHQLAVSFGILWRYIEDQYTAMGYRLNERGASILPVSLAFSYTGKKADAFGGRNFATIQGVYNVMSTGDSLDELWTGSDEHYWIARWQLARLQPLFGWFDKETGQDIHQWMLFFKLEGQYTSDTLIPVEKLALGGYNCMRGYRARGYLGDYGVYGTVELRTPVLVNGITALFGGGEDQKPLDRLQFLGFCDYGIANYNDLPSNYDDNEFLCSMGVGARLAVSKYSQLRCDLAFPVADGNNPDDKDCELYLGVQFQF